jgi:hypothetical protein
MTQKLARAAGEGALLGLAAGMVFASVQVAAGHSSDAPLRALQFSASVVLGQTGAETAPFGWALAVGLLVHLGISALFGTVYGLVVAAHREPRSGWQQAPLGLLYGLFVWAVNFQLVARATHPWFLGVPQLGQAALHAAFFGLPLALMHVRLARPPRPSLWWQPGEALA